MIVGDQDPGLEGSGHGFVGRGDCQPYFGAAAVAGTDRELRVDEHGAFSHAADAVDDPRPRGAGHGRRHGRPARRLDRDRDGARHAGLGVPGHVRERFLRDAVDDQLLLRESVSRVSRSPARHASCACSATRPPAARGRSGARGPRVLPVAAGARSLRTSSVPCRAVSRSSSSCSRSSSGIAPARPSTCSITPVGLSDLVVQLARDPLSLGLLHHQRAVRAVAPLGLQAIEHVVERPRQRGHVRLTVERARVARRERVVPAHRLGELVERPERRPEEEQVDRQRGRVSPTPSTTSSVKAGGTDTVTGANTSPRNASTSTAAFVAKTRQYRGSDGDAKPLGQASQAGRARRQPWSACDCRSGRGQGRLHACTHRPSIGSRARSRP